MQIGKLKMHVNCKLVSHEKAHSASFHSSPSYKENDQQGLQAQVSLPLTSSASALSCTYSDFFAAP
jgi:hypothetical protein